MRIATVGVVGLTKEKPNLLVKMLYHIIIWKLFRKVVKSRNEEYEWKK